MKNNWMWFLGAIVVLAISAYFGRNAIKSVLPSSITQTGNLVFAITDPADHALPPQAQGKDHKPSPTGTVQSNGQSNGPQTVMALTLTIAKIEVHFASDQTATPSPTESMDHWITLNMPSPTTVDLVKLASSHTFSTLGLTTLASEKYTQVRLFLSSASATLSDGTNVNLDILGMDNVVKVIQPFTVVAGKTTMLTMDFDAQHSVIKAGGKYILKPVVAKLIEQH